MSSHSRQASISSLISNSHHSHPQKIGPWRLGKTLGRGATGRVLLATHQTTGQKAAVKVVSKSELNDEGLNGKTTDDAGLPYGIEREIIIMKLLTHPNVLRLYDVWETSKALYLVLEYVEGGELFDLLVERGPLQEAEAIKYFRQIILGTAYCHALGICHRDLKPENLLLDDSLNVKLADFGMAALESNGKLLETSCGSPHYAAPEIVSGLKYHGAASDVWSCGVILFALLTGRLPFDDENIRNLLLKVQAGNFEMPGEISSEAKDLIGKMLTVDPIRRIPTEKILSHPLLNKYPIPNEDLISVKSLPHPETAYKSLGSVKNIDKQILSNLSILWHDRPQEEIINCLLKQGSNPEKTFYALLMRYRHNQDDQVSSTPRKSPSFNRRRGIAHSGSMSNKGTPRKKRVSQVTVSRPTSFQYLNGRASTNNARLSIASSVNNSPHKSPSKRFSYAHSPVRSPAKSPRKSPHKSPRRYNNQYDDAPPPAVPRNIYNDIVSAQKNGSIGSLPPSLPSKGNITVGKSNPIIHEVDTNELLSSARITTSPSKSKMRNSVIKKSGSKNRLSRRKSLRTSMTTGLKRNSITMKLLATYAKLSGETDWEYMNKQTKRTSATFATLCDKIFNQEQYDEDDENLIDEEEKQAKEYERLMEIERKKHEAEIRARKELEKKKRRQNRRSLLSSKKLSILIKDDNGINNSENEFEVDDSEIKQPKRRSKQNHRSVSDSATNNNKDELTAEEVENLKRRSVTQPVPRRRTTPVLKRRPVSRLDPLWTAYENEEINRAKEALDSELKEFRKLDEKRKGKHRESIILKEPEYNEKETMNAIEDDEKRISRDSYYNKEDDYELPEPAMDTSDLSEEYLSEIRKSRLLNSQLNINGIVNGEDSKGSKRASVVNASEPKTLIGDVKIPNVTRKSRCFTNSNKRLSVLTMYSTKESYRDLNSILYGTRDEMPTETANLPALRTSFADRLDRAGLTGEKDDDDDDDEPLDEGSIMDFDDHLANKRSSYYAGNRRNSKYSTVSNRNAKRISQRPTSQLPDLPHEEEEPDETFVTKNDEVHKRKSNYSDIRKSSRITGSDNKRFNNDQDDDSDVFDNIKLPEDKSTLRQANKRTQESISTTKDPRTKSMLPSAESMLIPDLKNIPNSSMSKPYPKVRKQKHPQTSVDGALETLPPMAPSHDTKKPLADSTNKQDRPAPQQKRNRSIFRKLSWGSKKKIEEATSKPTQLPSPAESRSASVEEKSKSNSFFRWFSSSHSSSSIDSEIKRFNTILPKQEMSTALFALLNSWSNFGLKNLKNDQVGYNITGAISKHNAFNLKNCKFRIKINPREFDQKSEIVCVRVKGSKVTTDTLFKEIEKVLLKEGVMEN